VLAMMPVAPRLRKAGPSRRIDDTSPRRWVHRALGPLLAGTFLLASQVAITDLRPYLRADRGAILLDQGME
jgi:hypothetical protein